MTGYTIGYIFGVIFGCLFLMAIAGGIYYLIARPKVTFVQAMFSKWIVLFGVTIFIVRIL